MMREIKFRAWNGSKMRGVDKNDFFSLRCDGMISMQLPDIDFEPPIMQHTGLKDKNGVEIYEGDIIHYDGYGDYIICWDDDSACFDTKLIGPCYEMFMSTNLFECSESTNQDSAKIIGNIYQNKELLK
jgi:uncharacterized phage protein (TIGR01671 family)